MGYAMGHLSSCIGRVATVGSARQRKYWPFLTRLLLGLVSTAAFGVASAGAQNGVVSGAVVAQSSGRSLAGVQIGVTGQPGKGAVTDASGRFRISGLAGDPGTQVSLSARMIGFRASQQVARIGETNVQFALTQQLVSLDQVVVTGTVGNQQARALGNSIAKVNAAEVVATAAVPSMQALINGRAPGVAVIPGTGMVGSGSKIRIRGASSFSLSGDPRI